MLRRVFVLILGADGRLFMAGWGALELAGGFAWRGVGRL